MVGGWLMCVTAQQQAAMHSRLYLNSSQSQSGVEKKPSALFFALLLGGERSTAQIKLCPHSGHQKRVFRLRSGLAADWC